MLQPARRLYRERSAGLVPVMGQTGPPQLDRFFDDTLSRLSSGHVEESWWRSLLDSVGHAYVAPDVLKRDDLQSWLKDTEVWAHFKALSGACLVGTPEAPEIRSRLRERYAAITQEPKYLADEPIEVVVAILLAAFVADLGSTGERLAWLTLESEKQTRAELKSGFEDVTRRLEILGPDRLVEEVHTQRASEELALVQQRRAWDPVQAREHVRQLLERVQSGDLRHADRAAQMAVLYWSARLHGGQPEHLEEAKSFRERLRQLNPTADTRILDALILEAEGNGDEALRMLRDVDNPDTRAVFFMFLKRIKGPAAALGWFDEREGRQDHTFLTGLGWIGVAVALAEAERWEEAAAYLAKAHAHQEDCLDLLFVEGVVNAALLLPPEFRRHALDMNLFHPEVVTVEGPEADSNREHATLCFQKAEERIAVLFPERALGARRWLLWLRLTHPDPAVNQAAREEVRNSIQEPEQALSVLQMARAFGIPFDIGRLRSFLDQRARMGGLEKHELQAWFMLAEMDLAPADLIAFLDEEEPRLRRVFPPGSLSVERIQALVKDGQSARARSLLDDRREEFEAAVQQRLETLIEAHEGMDPRPRLEKLYESNHGWEDLHNLVHHLYLVKDWAALRPRLEDLFQQQRTLQNALRLVECMQRNPESSEADILGFLEAHQDLMERNPDLIAARAWALYRTGRLDEAAALHRLLPERNRPSDLQLEINLACQSGAWERFSGIVEREWARREEHEPEALIRLASLAAEANKTDSRAVELLRLAAEKGRDEPHVLTAAIALAYRLGREGEELGDWLARAAALSSDEGPIKTINLRTLVEEWMPAHRERRSTIEELCRHGAIPLHVVASELNVPLSYLLIGLPRSNAPLQDGRWRTVIPIVSGVREPVLLRPEWAVGLDVTSLMVLTHLGLLRKAIESLQQVILAPDTMLLLLNERNRVRFHQPSLVKKAEEILALIGTGKLRSAEPLPTPPRWLTEEVGTDLAQLLQAARESQGHVVRPRPVYRLRSFLDEESQLGDYDDHVLSTVVLERLLYKRGYLDEASHERAARYLLSQDHGASSDAELTLLEHPLYLDDLAISYLQSAGLLHTLVNCSLDLRVHPSLGQEQSDLIAKYHEGEKLAEAIEEIRLTLRDAIQTGRARFLPRRDPEEKHKTFFDAAPTLGQFLLAAGTCDAFLIDDRYMNKNRILFDGRGEPVPLLCVLDVLRHIEAQGALTTEERQIALHRLRQSGFAFLPVEPEELKRLLTSVQWRPDGTFAESAELRVIRQTLARIRSLDMLRQSEENTFLGRIWYTSSWVISQFWIDEGFPVERAVSLTDWAWHYVAPSRLEWQEEKSIEAPVLFLNFLLQSLPLIKERRREVFLGWMEKRALEPLRPANRNVLDHLAVVTRRQIESRSEHYAEGEKALLTEYLIDLQPPTIREFLQRDEALRGLIGLETYSVIGFDERASVPWSDLFVAARRVLAQEEGVELLSLEGKKIAVSRQEDSIILQVGQDEGTPLRISLDTLGVLSSDRQERLQVLERHLRAIGPTGPDFGALRHVAAKRELTEGEVGELLDALWNGVAGLQARLRARLKTGKATVRELVPDSLKYFERFCGPNPGNLAPEEYLGSVLPEYRKGLLRRNLGRGLEICLFGALRDDLCPGAWLEEVSDDELWEDLELCQPQLEPFSLLGALDIALYRQHDERFRDFAEVAVAMLTAEQFPVGNGFDLYGLLPSLAQFVLNRIHLLDNGALQAPFWKRMCAWMQASVAIRLLDGLNIDFDRLRNQLESNLLPSGQYANLLDLRREPMYQAGELSLLALRGEVVGRLLQLQQRHQAADRGIPRADEIQEAVGRLIEAGRPLCWSLPGPLEGYRRPEESGSVLAEDLKDRLVKLPVDRLLASMVNLSQLFHFDEETRFLFRETISKPSLESDGIDTEERLLGLAHASVVAAAERDREIAQAIAGAVLTLAPSLQEDTTVFLAVHGLLIASAAFEEEGAWADWLKEQLSGLASRLPAGKASSRLYHHLQELKKVTNLDLGITSRAEALASAAASFLK